MTTKKRRQRQKMIRGSIRAFLCIASLVLMAGFIHLASKAFVGQATPEEASDAKDSGNSLVSGSSMLKKATDTPTSAPATGKPVTICLDAGHGGKDAGSENGSRLEKDDTLKLTLAISSYLKDLGIDVVLTRSDDTFLELSQRCDIANNANAAYFVSIHRNKGNGEGVETWIYSKADKETSSLADNIMDRLSDTELQRDRGVKRGMQESSSKDYYLNSHSNMPVCIVEMGFIDDDTDNELFDKNMDAYAKAIGDAILATCDEYKGTTGGKLPGEKSEASAKDGKKDDEPQEGEEDKQDPKEPESTSHTITNTPIEDLASLDNTTQIFHILPLNQFQRPNPGSR